MKVALIGSSGKVRTETERLRDLLRQALTELEYFKNKYGEFRPILMSEIKKEFDK